MSRTTDSQNQMNMNIKNEEYESEEPNVSEDVIPELDEEYNLRTSDALVEKC